MRCINFLWRNSDNHRWTTLIDPKEEKEFDKLYCTYSTTATHSISTSTFFGNVRTATQLLAGFGSPNALPVSWSQNYSQYLLVNLVHLREILHICKKNIDFNHGLNTWTCSLQNSIQIREALLLHRQFYIQLRKIFYSVGFDIAVN